MDNLILSLVFSEFNKARGASKIGQLDEARVLRAFKIIRNNQLPEKRAKYQCTTKDCLCPDHVERGFICKHMIACMIMYRVSEMMQKIWLGEVVLEGKRKQWNLNFQLYP